MAPIKEPLLIEAPPAVGEAATPEINGPSGLELAGLVRSPISTLLIVDLHDYHENGEHYPGSPGFQNINGGGF